MIAAPRTTGVPIVPGPCERPPQRALLTEPRASCASCAHAAQRRDRAIPRSAGQRIRTIGGARAPGVNDTIEGLVLSETGVPLPHTRHDVRDRGVEARPRRPSIRGRCGDDGRCLGRGDGGGLASVIDDDHGPPRRPRDGGHGRPPDTRAHTRVVLCPPLVVDARGDHERRSADLPPSTAHGGPAAPRASRAADQARRRPRRPSGTGPTGRRWARWPP